MTKLDRQPPAPVPFPAWPFDCMSLYSHLARDFGRYAQKVTQASDPADTLRAEGDYGVSLFHDLMKGYYDLAVMPFNVMMGAFTTTTTPGEPAQPTESKNKAAEPQ